MGLQWEDERYVRLYTRDTATWVRLTWQARFVLMSLLRKLDRAGRLELGEEGEEGVEALAAVIQVPPEIVRDGLPALLKRGIVVQNSAVLVMPNFIAAQESRASDKARQQAKRERARMEAMEVTQRDEESRNVTESHGESRGVTASHTASHSVTPSHAVPCLAVPSRAVLSHAVPDDITAEPAAPVAAAPLFLAPQEVTKKPVKAAKKPAADKTLALTTPTWNAFSAAYEQRHGTAPVRDYLANRQLKEFIERVGAVDAPAIAAHYVGDSTAYYVTQRHPIFLLVRDYQKLRTNWLTGQRINAHTARQNEQTAGNPAWAYALELERKEREGQ